MSTDPVSEGAMIRAPRIADHELWEYLDGGLPWPSRVRIALQLAFDPELAFRAEAFMRQTRQLQALNRWVLADALPERFRRILRDAEDASDHPPNCSAPLQIQVIWLAIALTVVAGCLGWLAF